MDLRNAWVGFFLLCSFFLVTFCEQDGFLSLSCGGRTSLRDSSNISWVPDSTYITSGKTTTITYSDGSSSLNISARFFSNSRRRKCYRIPANNSTTVVLVRAKFVYKNYDGLGKPPKFSVSVGTAIAATINLAESDPWSEEFLWTVNKDTLSFCLIAIPKGGSPVISSLEIRPLPQGAYTNGMTNFPNKLLRKSYRIDCGHSNESLRYPLDPFDRIWDADRSFTPFHVATGFKIQLSFNKSSLVEEPPAAVLQTGRVLARRNTLTYNLPFDTLGDYYIILYFAGILPVFPSFDVFINGELVQSNYTINSSETSALYVTQKGIESLNITLKSISFYPQINAFEVYNMVDIPSDASSTTVSALQVIQKSTGLDLGWQDDPCLPSPWEKIDCEGSLVTSLDLSDINLRSISPTFGDLLDLKILDLHNTSLSGEIQNLDSLNHLEKLNLSFNQLTSIGADLENLMNLQILDLQNNSLMGVVPDSLGELEDLHLLNLENNKLQGPLPQSLNKETLEIRASGNLCLTFSTTSCDDASSSPPIEAPQVTVVPQKKHNVHNHLAIILGTVAGATLAFLLMCISVLLYKTKQQYEVSHTSRAEMDMRNWGAAKVFSYKEIKVATRNFKEVIGRGSFGSVYLGKLPDGKSVAVKVRFDKSQLGADSFINEVNLLSKIRHQNLVSLEGFCHERKHQILVYEYLPGGSLADHLYGTNSQKTSLNWVRRLKIAVDAAKGLDYLHNGSEPRIIHRDIKCSNILLDMDMNAKVCDLGLSKQVTQEDATHVTTVVKGTAGYLDPEYYSTQQLTEKSDVYSFGVVLLELICGREPLTHSGTPDSFNLVLWAKPYLQAGAYEIVDEDIRGSFDPLSMRKVALIAIKSVERDASQRPSIAEVLAELKEAYNIQLTLLDSSQNDN
ncbi:probable LRR receptor-like serine/threonine-protein kinase At5g48740 isoform X1 [Cajanus cajan]|uniref:non-specific serine/threonine protein kinase n=1 Tax=Cajanus cajan TaxID=3821 RepID=A0A151RIN9_CAJCA|nr:probable LRR receptor-like serine/threonine-protein kinase At5g48740 isoform X1 [Cajanus cajan]KYP42408.1 putative LRR receptor-like serine/threonine-protein kinase At5g48740 family [Cajanus cajan]